MRTPFSSPRVALSAAIVALTAAVAQAQTGRVVGIVKDEGGQPIKGATLSLENPDASPRNFTATSDDRGRFAVIGLKAGEWSLVAQAPGFQPEVARLAVRATTPSAPMLTLRRAPLPPPSALGGVGIKDLQSELRTADQQYAGQQWDQAIASYKTILSKAPALSVINLQLAAAYRSKKDYDNAVSAYNELIKAEPNNEQARVGLAQTYVEKGDLTAAANALTQAASQASAKEIFFTLGEVETARGNTDAAVQWYQKASADDPNWGKPLLKLGLTSLRKGDKVDAAAKMERVVAVDPLSAEAAQAKTVLEQQLK
jgi:tetratricopeptide (TPR) repeat protein